MLKCVSSKSSLSLSLVFSKPVLSLTFVSLTVLLTATATMADNLIGDGDRSDSILVFLLAPARPIDLARLAVCLP